MACTAFTRISYVEQQHRATHPQTDDAQNHVSAFGFMECQNAILVLGVLRAF